MNDRLRPKAPSRGEYLQPERRSGFRIVTLKNAGWLLLAVVVAFVLYSAYGEFRERGDSDYGRLYDGRIDPAKPAPKPPPKPVR